MFGYQSTINMLKPRKIKEIYHFCMGKNKILQPTSCTSKKDS